MDLASASPKGGLLDVIVDRDFAQNNTIYFSYAEPFNGGGRTGASTGHASMTMRCHTLPTNGHLPAARTSLQRKTFRQPYRAGERRQLLCHQWRAVHRPQRQRHKSGKGFERRTGTRLNDFGGEGRDFNPRHSFLCTAPKCGCLRPLSHLSAAEGLC